VKIIKERSRMIEFIALYVWSIVATLGISLHNIEKQYGCIYISKLVNYILILTPLKEKKVPIYEIVVHVFIQLISITFLIVILCTDIEQYAWQKVYGIVINMSILIALVGNIISQLLNNYYQKK